MRPLALITTPQSKKTARIKEYRLEKYSTYVRR